MLARGTRSLPSSSSKQGPGGSTPGVCNAHLEPPTLLLLASPCFFLFFSAVPVACRMILVPRPGIKPVPPEVEARSLNHWTAREVRCFPMLGGTQS